MKIIKGIKHILRLLLPDKKVICDGPYQFSCDIYIEKGKVKEVRNTSLVFIPSNWRKFIEDI